MSEEPADAAVAALLTNYIELYARDALPRWRALFLPSFVAAATNEDGSVTSWSLDEFYERQRNSFASGKPIAEVLEDVRIDRIGRLAGVRANFVWTDGEASRHGRLMMLAIDERGAFRIQSLAFSYHG